MHQKIAQAHKCILTHQWSFSKDTAKLTAMAWATTLLKRELTANIKANLVRLALPLHLFCSGELSGFNLRLYTAATIFSQLDDINFELASFFFIHLFFYGF